MARKRNQQQLIEEELSEDEEIRSETEQYNPETDESAAPEAEESAAPTSASAELTGESEAIETNTAETPVNIETTTNPQTGAPAGPTVVIPNAEELTDEEFINQVMATDFDNPDLPFPDAEEEAPPAQAETQTVAEEDTKQSVAKEFASILTSEQILDYASRVSKESEQSLDAKIGNTHCEIVPESKDSAVKKAARLNPNRFKDDMHGVNLYIDGMQCTKEDFVDFIEANKEEFVAAMIAQFPQVEQMIREDIAKQQAELEAGVQQPDTKGQPTVATKGEQTVETDTKDTPQQAATTKDTTQQTHEAHDAQEVKGEQKKEQEKGAKQPSKNPLEENKKKAQSIGAQTLERLDLSERISRATGRQAVDEIAKAQEAVFEKGKVRSAMFYLTDKNGQVDHVVEFIKTRDKDLMKLDGAFVNDAQLKKVIAQYPHQLSTQVDGLMKLPQPKEKQQSKGQEH